MTLINVKIFEKNFIGLNDQKLAETYSPERIFAKNAFLNILSLVRLFWDLEKFRKISKFSILDFRSEMVGNMLKPTLQPESTTKCSDIFTKNLVNQLVGVGIQWSSTTKCSDITNLSGSDPSLIFNLLVSVFVDVETGSDPEKLVISLHLVV